jgi:hypothetical protein
VTNLLLFLAKYVFLGFLYLFLFWAVRSIAVEGRRLASAAERAPRLHVAGDKGPPLIVPLTNNITVGRLPANDIVINDNTVSSRHARVIRQNGGWIIEDSGSSNGTFLNGKRIIEPCPLADDDRIKVGRTIITIELGDVN